MKCSFSGISDSSRAADERQGGWRRWPASRWRPLPGGGNGAAHGGTLPLLFDEVLGRLSNARRPLARTAYLKVNYRHITPIDVELDVEARVERQEGRKRWLTGRLLHGETLVADAEGLFVQLLPGQP